MNHHNHRESRIENPVIYVPIRHLYICREPSTNQPFYAKQTQFLKSQMNVTSLLTSDYENNSNWTLGQNKPNSNPIKPNLQKAKMNVNLTLTKDYRKKDDFAVRINKPNSNQISQKAKMNVNLFSTKDYENETTLRPKKTNPIKPCPERSRMGQFQTRRQAAS